MSKIKKIQMCIKCQMPPVQLINGICWFCRHEKELKKWKNNNSYMWKCPNCEIQFNLFMDKDLEKLYIIKDYDSKRMCPNCGKIVNYE